ncbi:hypothetical protein FK268_19035 [Tsukamurella sputi]|uniref:DUF5642 domain-containing protein n=1 Tax=Tsukamurella sputi TaxID=2591848 RepID=A0A5C5RHK5_9ACTN|nr:hypothetical protein [Tsukamurella sputi]TWS22559.1 hypothetical protein FK268_19035 [Tsukamurella sputi]
MTAAVGLALTACGGGSGNSAPSSQEPSAPPVDPAKTLTQADAPAGLTVATVPDDAAFQSAMQAVGQVQAAAITPASCKDKNVAAQQEMLETIKFGTQQSLSKDKTVRYGVTLLPNSARLSLFEAAGTGECGSITFGDSLKQTTTRKELPAGVNGAQGFVFEISRVAGGQTAHSASAYFTKNGVLAMVNANPGADGTVDTATFDEVVKRVAAKL